MAIRVDTYKIEKSKTGKGWWTYDFTYDVTQKQLINDTFFDELGFVEFVDMDTTIRNWTFYRCDASDIDFIRDIIEVIPCPQQISVSITPGYKFGPNNYRYEDNTFGWICQNIFQDVAKAGISVKGQSYSPIINEPSDETTLLSDAIKFMMSIAGDDYTAHCSPNGSTKYKLNDLTNYSKARSYIVKQPSIEIGLINSNFTTLSCQQEYQILPKNFKKAIDKNTVSEVQFECTLEGDLLIGRMTEVVKRMFAVGDPAGTIEGSGGGIDEDGGSPPEPLVPDNVNETQKASWLLDEVVDETAVGQQNLPPSVEVETLCTLHNVTLVDFSTPITQEEQYGIEPTLYSVEKFARLTGEPNSYILTNNLTQFFYQGNGAVSFWVRTTASGYGYLCGQVSRSGNELHCYKDSDGYVVFKMSDSAKNKFALRSDRVIDDGQQHFVYITWLMNYCNVYKANFGAVYVNGYQMYKESQLEWLDKEFDVGNHMGQGCLWDKGVIKNNLECDLSIIRYHEPLPFELGSYLMIQWVQAAKPMFNP